MAIDYPPTWFRPEGGPPRASLWKWFDGGRWMDEEPVFPAAVKGSEIAQLATPKPIRFPTERVKPAAEPESDLPF